MAADLPSSKSSDIELTQPTNEEILHQTKLNSVEWRGALTPEAYLRREEFMQDKPLYRDGGLSSWVLVTKNDKIGRRVLSGCETIRKKAFVARDGQVKEVICHGVASVFCPPEFRGKGYAGRMIKDLGEKLSNWQTDSQDCLFSVLYSDIGKVGQSRVLGQILELTSIAILCIAQVVSVLFQSHRSATPQGTAWSEFARIKITICRRYRWTLCN